MNKQEMMSPLIGVISGVIGILGFAAAAFNAWQDGGLRLSVMLFTNFFPGFVFLYASFFGKYPWDRSNAVESDE